MKFEDFKTEFRTVVEELFKDFPWHKEIQDDEDNCTITLSKEDTSDVKIDFQLINSTPLEEDVEECVLFNFISFGNMDTLIPVIEKSELISTTVEESIREQILKALSDFSWNMCRIKDAMDQFQMLAYPVNELIPDKR